MKLLKRTGYYFLGSSFVIFLLGGLGLFLALNWILDHEVDEGLVHTRQMLLPQLNILDTLPAELWIMDEVIRLEPDPTENSTELFSDSVLWSKNEAEFVPIRLYSYGERIKGQFYRVSIGHSKVEQEDLLFTIGWLMLSMLALLFIGQNIFNAYFSKRIWQPFYHTLEKMASFSFSSEQPLEFAPSAIEEFAALNQSIEKMTAKMAADYRSLKQFTENASHEIQTPLAIIKNKLELLMQTGNLDRQAGASIQEIQQAAGRLSKLNHSLILLTRLENRQYVEVQTLPIYSLIDQKLEQLEPFIEAKQLEVESQLTAMSLGIHPDLADVLLNNLLGNAIKHNVENGRLEIRLHLDHLFIRNTGLPVSIPADELFNRFQKGDDAQASLGLGLAIVREICRYYDFSITYEIHGRWHELTVFWNLPGQ